MPLLPQQKRSEDGVSVLSVEVSDCDDDCIHVNIKKNRRTKVVVAKARTINCVL